MTTKTRFAPSPTGHIHLGNARTAIINALVAQRSATSGTFMLRIEDTDVERSKEKHIRGVCEDLRALGIEWTEGEDVGGEYGPYRQSQRLDIYQKYFNELTESGYAYRCFCTPSDLLEMRRKQKMSGVPPRYDGRCCRLEEAAVEKKISEHQPFVLRFNTKFNYHADSEIKFSDLVKGELRFLRREIGDFVIRKVDGMPTFFFGNAIDDSLMDVTHVLRGDDHLTNTPRQIMLLEALNLTQPQYGHLSTVMGEDGSPLSKRNGSRNIRELLEEGWLPLAINNYLARLGHYYATDKLLSLKELADDFSFSNLGKAAAKFDWSLLAHWQRQVLMIMDDQRRWEWMKSEVESLVEPSRRFVFAQNITNNILLPKEAVAYAEMIYQENITLTDEQIGILNSVEKGLFVVALETYQRGDSFLQMTQNIQKKFGYKGKQLFQPLRIALTGMNHGPEMVQLLSLMPSNIVFKRLKNWV